MTQQNNELQIDVVVLKSALARQRIMKPHFRLPLSAEQANECLMVAIATEVENRQRTLDINEGLQKRVRKMASWLTNEYGKQGMLLCGGCGNGKTTFIKAFRTLLNLLHVRNFYDNTIYGMRFMTAKDIVTLYRTNFKAWRDLASCTMLAIDDLGCEPTEIMDFGNVSNPIIDLLSIRYEEQLFTIISTNFKASDIRTKYGDRIADRLNEMVERIYFDNDSYRTDEYK